MNAKESKKSMKESVKPEIQLMVNNIIDELIGEYSSKEWDALSPIEKFDIVRTEYFLFGYKSRYLSEVRDLVIENMNHPFNVVFESKKSTRKSMKEFDDLTRYDMIGKGFFVLINIDVDSFCLCEQLGDKTQDTNVLRSFDTEKQARNYANKKGLPIVEE